jgi:hypothetical protein
LIFNGLFFVKKFFIDLQQVSILGQKIIPKKLVYIRPIYYLYYVLKIKDMDRFETNLGIIVGSHLNDAMIEVTINPQLAKQRMKFVKALTFFNEDLTKGVTDEYCDWLWNELFENQRWGGPYVKGTNYETK